MTTETPAGRFVRRRPTCLAMRVSEHNLAEVAAWAWQKPRLDAAERCVLLDSEIRA